mgnify:FL=1
MSVEVLESEIVSRVPAGAWNTMNIQEQRWLVSTILRARPDANSQFAAMMMERAIPVFNHWTIIRGR